MKIGLDIGSTTMKCILLDDDETIIFDSYERHFSQIPQKASELLSQIIPYIPSWIKPKLAISGSAGMGIAEACGFDFVQEVYATKLAANRYIPNANVIIELGGEDAKILFLDGGLEVRMNGSCAGGTGAFIDQMATLLGITQNDMNEMAKSATEIYTIASRCGVFAKSDIQPLINQGAKRSDISASIFSAVVNQTIGGLAQGRPIEGNVVYLGGPLTFLDQLRKSFDASLHVTGTCPPHSLYYVALGAAHCAQGTPIDVISAIEQLRLYQNTSGFLSMQPLFSHKDDYSAFQKRHNSTQVEHLNPETYQGPAFLGIDAGSTTVKASVITPEGQLLYERYQSNTGNPVPIVREYLHRFLSDYPNISILSSAVTGYGEDIIKRAFHLDHGIVETIAHLTAAKQFLPEVEFIIDIGGQDIKCFKIRDGVVDTIFLNEACSSGCGSFLQTFANALGYSIDTFAQLGLLAQHPVDLGSRCTVFMNSSVKQAQKDGATVEDISAGLSISVVKNALYKVIRASSAEHLGKHIVVQGGTFLNDAVLRAFEQELDCEVVRPAISGLMGAYGAALFAKEQYEKSPKATTLMNLKAIESLTHSVTATRCKGCNNNCQLTINIFGENERYISGNRCEKPITGSAHEERAILRDIFTWKLARFQTYHPQPGARGKIGIPFGLNMYELLPFWHSFFTELGFEVITSPPSNRALYLNGQATIPSDTVCFPAKLMHGHIQYFIDQDIKKVFYPCMTYNIDEHKGDNHFNCPVVAYYPEVIAANMTELKKKDIDLITDYVGLRKKHHFKKRMFEILKTRIPDLTLREINNASKVAYQEQKHHTERMRTHGQHIIDQARKDGRPIIVLCGRPYHVDPEVNHGISRLILDFNVSIINEEVLSYTEKKQSRTVLNQWTYHARMYDAARRVCKEDDMNLVQLVSFGCGLDAVTTDEVRDILEAQGKIYTQIKIDEITNLGAVKIRLRSLFAALGYWEEGKL